jgi:acyl-coenzyme A thioesterase PaaI-like protein
MAAEQEDIAAAGGQEDIAAAGGQEDIAAAGGQEDIAAAGGQEDIAAAGGQEDIAAASGGDEGEPRHVLHDLGWEVTRVDDGLHGVAEVYPEMLVPGTGHLRTSILAVWADTLAGLLSAHVIGPRVPVTLELDVHLYHPAPGAGLVRGEGQMVKSGRSVVVASVDFTTGEGEPIGFAAASFMAAPDATIRFRTDASIDRILPSGRRLMVPFAERAGCERGEPGVAILSHSDEVLNASNTVNGGLLALAAEEAALSLAPGSTITSLGLRYLQPVRRGPVIAVAQVHEGLGRMEVRDGGASPERLCVLATSRITPP